MRVLRLTLMGALALAACDSNSVAPEQEASISANESAAAAESARRRGWSYDRLLERVKELGDPEAEELAAELRGTLEAVRAAMEAGDRETARELMRGSREAMRTLRAAVFPDAPDSFPKRARRFDRQSRENGTLRFDEVVQRVRTEGGSEAQALLDEVLKARQEFQEARDAGDREAARTHAQALRTALRDAFAQAFPERFEEMQQRRGRGWRQRS